MRQSEGGFQTPDMGISPSPMVGPETPCYRGFMKITLEYAAMVRVNAPPSGSSYELPDGSTASDLLDALGISKAHKPTMAVFIHNKRVLLSHPIREDDHVYLTIPFGGG